jgi:D-serine dehydratase
VVVSGGGSTYFDRVIDRLSPSQFDGQTTLMLRSGCYVVHDCALYEDDSPLAARGTGAEGRLAAALEVWGRVLSCPEPGLAICGLGKRDVSSDYLPPQAIASRLGGEIAPAPPEWTVERVMDHHTFLRTGSDRLSPGDWVGFGINHPCTTFDKWPAIALVDDDYVVRDVVRTLF